MVLRAGIHCEHTVQINQRGLTVRPLKEKLGCVYLQESPVNVSLSVRQRRVCLSSTTAWCLVPQFVHSADGIDASCVWLQRKKAVLEQNKEGVDVKEGNSGLCPTLSSRKVWLQQWLPVWELGWLWEACGGLQDLASPSLDPSGPAWVEVGVGAPAPGWGLSQLPAARALLTLSWLQWESEECQAIPDG